MEHSIEIGMPTDSTQVHVPHSPPRMESLMEIEDAVENAREDGDVTWLTDHGERIAAIVPVHRVICSDEDDESLVERECEREDTQCTVSSWRGHSKKPYGPGGHNRCTLKAGPHQEHIDGFGNVFVVNPSFKLLRHQEA